jgi:hypothetical protein
MRGTACAKEFTGIGSLHAFSGYAKFSTGLSPVPKSDAVIIKVEWWRGSPSNTNKAHRRTNTEKAVPTNPENRAKIRYNVPISLALQDKNHLSVHMEIFFIKYLSCRLKLTTRKLIWNI